MSDISAMVAELIAAGCAPDIAAKVVAGAFVAGVNSATFRGIPVETPHEKRKAYDRERKRKSAEFHRNSTGIPNSLNIEESKKDKISRGTRIPPEWKPDESDRDFAKQLGWSDAQIDNEAAGFRDYWLAKAGSGGVKLNWSLTWRNWVRNSKVKPANSKPHLVVSEKISIEEAVKMFASTGRLSRFAPINDISQAPPELLEKHGLMADGRKIAGQSNGTH